jgi:hypothetical protein
VNMFGFHGLDYTDFSLWDGCNNVNDCRG